MGFVESPPSLLGSPCRTAASAQVPEPLQEWCETETREGLVTRGDVEMPVHQMGRRTWACQALDGEAVKSRQFLRDVMERCRDAGHRIERAMAAMEKDQRCEICNILDG